MADSIASRSVWTTALISFVGGPFAGFLWIGRGLAAISCLLLISGLGVVLLYIGFPVFPGTRLNEALASYSSLLAGLLWSGLVVPFAGRSIPDKWYSHGASVLLLAGAVGLGVALGVRTFLFQPLSMAAMSMAPNVEQGDYLIAKKNAYGYGLFIELVDSWPAEERWLAEQPQRGDVVIFRSPLNLEADYIMRVVGLPGETIQMIDGVLHIDNVPAALEPDGTYENAEMLDRPIVRQRETLPNGVSYKVLNISDDSMGDDTAPVKVPAGQYFMLGDNRDLSADSRFELGTVPFDYLRGRADRIFWNVLGNDYTARQKVAAGR